MHTHVYTYICMYIILFLFNILIINTLYTIYIFLVIKTILFFEILTTYYKLALCLLYKGFALVVGCNKTLLQKTNKKTTLQCYTILNAL